MKKILIILALLMPFVTLAQGKFKLKETSAKEKPSWINDGNSVDYIICQVVRVPDFEKAKANVLSNILNEIAKSVAVTVSGEESVLVTEVMGTDNDYQTQEYVQNTQLKVAKMPAIQGVSLANADMYWECYFNKKKQESYYNVYVRYPFSYFDRQQLVDAYNAQEAAYDKRLSDFENMYSSVTSIEDVEDALNGLKLLKNDVGDEDKRIDDINVLSNKFRKIFDNISVEVVENTREHLRFHLSYNGKKIATKTMPSFKANCATQFVATVDGDDFVVKYDCFDCYAQDTNYVDVKFRTGSKVISSRIYIKL